VASAIAERLNVELARERGQRDLSIDYLRTTLILIVLAHHSMLAYTSFAGFRWQDMIVGDATRWAVFDYATSFNEVFFMALLFFVSGLFVYPALRRRSAGSFLRDRSLRLGAPFAFSVAFLVPIGYYSSWRITGHQAGFISFYRLLTAQGFAIGPPWFIWELLLFDVVLALAFVPLGRWLPQIERSVSRLHSHPVAAFVGIFFLSVLVYVPLLSRYGYNTWANLVTWPFSFQISRIGLYALWFLFGFVVGLPGLEEGLIAHYGKLARHWPGWVLVCILAFSAMLLAPRWTAAHLPAMQHFRGLATLFWVASCAASCFGFLAFFRGIELPSKPWMNSLSRSAYTMYLVHYLFIVWTQRVLLGRPIHAGIKFLFVFLATTLLSWLAAQVLLRIPKLATIL
jgi:glucans biosynthesis protein C